MPVTEIVSLPGGPRLLLQSLPESESVALGFWIPAGARQEGARYAGTAHFVEHLLFKGTRRRSARDLVECIDGVGGNLNAFTSREYTAMTCKVLNDHIDLAFDVLQDMFAHSRFPADEIERERQVILEEVRMYDDAPDDLIHDLFNRVAWRGTSISRPILGTMNTLPLVSRKVLIDFYHREYRPDQLLITVAGRFDRERVLRLARMAARRSPVRRRRRAQAGFNGCRLRVRKEVGQVHTCIGWQGMAWASPVKPVMQVLNTVLGGGMSSRLFQEVRERRGLAYAVYSYLSAYRTEGALVCYAGTAPGNLSKVLRCIARETERLQQRRLSAKELRRVKEQIKGRLVLGLESNAARNNFNAVHYIFTGDVPAVDRVLRQIDNVTVDQVQALARRVFRTRPALVTIGPDDDMRPVVEGLGK